MTNSLHKRAAQGGFTLAEMLVVMFLLSLLSLLTLNVTGPWLAFRSQMETEQRLTNIRTAVESWYEQNAYAAELQASGNFGLFTNSVSVSGLCSPQPAAYASISANLDAGPGAAGMDGYKNDFCVMVKSQSQVVDGVTLYYRVIAFVSLGADRQLDAATGLGSGNVLNLGGDDLGFVYSGLPAQIEKLHITQERLARAAKLYEMHFTNRYLSNSNRDISKYYFSDSATGGDSGNIVRDTAGTWTKASTLLTGIGVGPDLTVTPWDLNQDIYVGNSNEAVTPPSGNTVFVRSPSQTSYPGAGPGFLPYTALLRAQVPSPSATPSYVVRVAVGGY